MRPFTLDELLDQKGSATFRDRFRGLTAVCAYRGPSDDSQILLEGRNSQGRLDWRHFA